jgi:hypothetical protein
LNLLCKIVGGSNRATFSKFGHSLEITYAIMILDMMP